MNLLKTLEKFWRQHPALLLALSCLIGVNSALHWHSIYLVPIFLMMIPIFAFKQSRLRGLLALSLMGISYFYVTTAYLFPELPEEGVEGKANIEISSLTENSTSFGKRWIYRGTIKSFQRDDGAVIGKNIPFTLSLPQKQDLYRPIASRNYVVSGTLKKIAPHYYVLNSDKEQPWFSVENTWSPAEWRFRFKQLVNAYIKDHINGKREATFLGGIATGDFDDRTMMTEFGRFGLQHIMAISGFHFAIIASILSVFIRLVISKQKATWILMALLSFYFVFLGSASSILRAWVTILIALYGFLIEKRASGLNSLGMAMLVVLWIDPLLSQGIGFQFSFIITASILMFYGSSEALIQFILKKRPLNQLIEMDLFNQHGYCAVSFLRQALSITLAVNILAVPLTLYFFQKFPLMSLLYNLFFPFLVSISMLLLLTSFLFFFIPFLSTFIHTLNFYYTRIILNFVYNMPSSLDLTIRTSALPLEWILIYLCLIFTLGIFLKERLEKENESLQDLVFI